MDSGRVIHDQGVKIRTCLPVFPVLALSDLCSSWRSDPASATMIGAKAAQWKQAGRSFSVVSRRAVQRFQATRDSLGHQAKKSSKPIEDEKPWPRSFVLGFFGVVSFVVPYTAAWYLAQHGPVRDTLLLDWLGVPDDHAVLQWMRRTFGTIDWAEHPDNHSGLQQQDKETHALHYKLDDEPTLAVRNQQAQVQARNAESVQVLVTTGGSQDSTEELTELPACTPANFSSFGGPVALDFPDDDTQDQSDDISNKSFPLFAEAKDLQMSIYSLWHHHVPQEPLHHKAEPASNTVRLELDRLESQIQEIELSVQNGRSFDEVRSELGRLRSEQRRLQFRKYFW